MRIYRLAQVYLDEEENQPPTKSINDVEPLLPEIVRVAQDEYDKWDESDIDVYAGGGICHLIADRIADVLNENDIDAYTVSDDDQHVLCIVRVIEGIGMVDIHHSWYETGAAFTWTKIPGVIFDPSNVTVEILDSDYNNLKNYVEL